MNTVLKFGISFVVGLIIMWVCYQPLHMDSPVTTFVAILFTLAAYAVCDKAMPKKK